jgi:hypothetical protein
VLEQKKEPGMPKCGREPMMEGGLAGRLAGDGLLLLQERSREDNIRPRKRRQGLMPRTANVPFPAQLRVHTLVGSWAFDRVSPPDGWQPKVVRSDIDHFSMEGCSALC